MNYLLLFLVLAVCGGAYYEHTIQAEALLTDEQQISDLEAKVQSLEAAHKQAEAANAPQPSSSTLVAPSTAMETHVLPPPPPLNPNESSNATPTPSPNDLGTIVTLDGRTFQSCRLLKVEPDGITFNHTEGITKVLFPLLRPELQKQYGYDPHATP